MLARLEQNHIANRMTARLPNANSSANISAEKQWIRSSTAFLLSMAVATPLHRHDKFYSVRRLGTQSDTSRTSHTFSVVARVRINIWLEYTIFPVVTFDFVHMYGLARALTLGRHTNAAHRRTCLRATVCHIERSYTKTKKEQQSTTTTTQYTLATRIYQAIRERNHFYK